MDGIAERLLDCVLSTLIYLFVLGVVLWHYMLFLVHPRYCIYNLRAALGGRLAEEQLTWTTAFIDTISPSEPGELPTSYLGSVHSSGTTPGTMLLGFREWCSWTSEWFSFR